jgi:integrase
MAAHRRPTPSYLEHKQSGRARAVWTDEAGTRHDRLLPGPYGSAESKKAYARLLLELEVSPQPAARTPRDRAGLTVAELLLAYLRFAQRHYRDPDGRPTGEYQHFKVVCRHVRELYGTTPAAEFGPLALKAVRQQFVAAGWCRKTVNQQTERVRRVFRWAVAEELVPPAVHHALVAVAGLQKGRTAAPEPAAVGPVADAHVDATLPYLTRQVRGLVEFQRLTGCRPGEACAIRRADIDTGGAVWLYTPHRHKNQWRGKGRTIAVGPKAQEVLREFFAPDLDTYLFSPRQAVEEARAVRAANRKTPRYPSHMKRNAAKRVKRPRRVPAEHYTARSYSVAVARAIEAANVAGQEQAKKERREFTPIPHWHPNQLRHTFATKIRKAHGLEAAQVLLGHSKADVTQVYAEKNTALAVEIAAQLG